MSRGKKPSGTILQPQGIESQPSNPTDEHTAEDNADLANESGPSSTRTPLREGLRPVAPTEPAGLPDPTEQSGQESAQPMKQDPAPETYDFDPDEEGLIQMATRGRGLRPIHKHLIRKASGKGKRHNTKKTLLYHPPGPSNIRFSVVLTYDDEIMGGGKRIVFRDGQKRAKDDEEVDEKPAKKLSLTSKSRMKQEGTGQSRCSMVDAILPAYAAADAKKETTGEDRGEGDCDMPSGENVGGNDQERVGGSPSREGDVLDPHKGSSEDD
ncbi:hypothetical protein K470DRAFT_288694 [Piedraia hortae CBS 480.64]|uniref:Uncharacterized protein n=1 Tax=Piedraia hortae CBS 480.64 TaxID=1314780 RepID=A0A6A7BVS6_9PEZI|nr:hypothetical protein K470DRAFT_288694 [Piedraia hortae CBS 480.64]